MNLDLTAKCYHPLARNTPHFRGTWQFPDDLNSVSPEHQYAHNLLQQINGNVFLMYLNNIFDIHHPPILVDGFIKEPIGNSVFMGEIENKRITFTRSHHPSLRKIWTDINTIKYTGKETSPGKFKIDFVLHETATIPKIKAAITLVQIADFNNN